MPLEPADVAAWQFSILLAADGFERGPALELLVQQIFDLGKPRLVAAQDIGRLAKVVGSAHALREAARLRFEGFDLGGQRLELAGFLEGELYAALRSFDGRHLFG